VYVFLDNEVIDMVHQTRKCVFSGRKQERERIHEGRESAGLVASTDRERLQLVTAIPPVTGDVEQASKARAVRQGGIEATALLIRTVTSLR